MFSQRFIFNELFTACTLTWLAKKYSTVKAFLITEQHLGWQIKDFAALYGFDVVYSAVAVQ